MIEESKLQSGLFVQERHQLILLFRGIKDSLRIQSVIRATVNCSAALHHNMTCHLVNL